MYVLSADRTIGVGVPQAYNITFQATVVKNIVSKKLSLKPYCLKTEFQRNYLYSKTHKTILCIYCKVIFVYFVCLL